MNGSHDRYTHRPGDFDFLMDLIRTAADRGLGRFETIFLRKTTLTELVELLSILDPVPGLETRSLTPFDFRGRGKYLESQRPSVSDLTELPEDALRFLNLETYRPESAWLQTIASGETPEQTRRYYLMPITEKTIRQLRTEQPETVLSLLRETDAAFRRRIPPLRDLTDRYGNPDGQKLYALRDLAWKWTDAYLAEHPDIDRSGRFDDRTPCMLCK